MAQYFSGCSFALLANILITTFNIMCKKYFTIPAYLFLIFEGIVMIFTNLWWVMIKHREKAIVDQFKESYHGILLRSVPITIAVLLLLAVIRTIPISDFSAIANCLPVILVCMLGWIVFKEKPTNIQILFMIFGLGGVLLICRPTIIFGGADYAHYPYRITGTIGAISASFLIAVSVIGMRFIGFSCDVTIVNITTGALFVVGGIIYAGVMFIFFGDNFLSICDCLSLNVAILVGCSFLISFAAACEMLSVQRIQAALFSAICTLRVPFDFVAQIIFFNEDGAHLLSFAGVVIVVFSIGFVSLKLDEKIKRKFSI